MNVDVKLNKNKTQCDVRVEVAARLLARDRKEECGTKRIKNFLLEEGYDVHDCLKEDYINNFGSGKLVGTWSFSLGDDNKKAEKAAAEKAAAKKKAEEQAASKKKAEDLAAAKKRAEERSAPKKNSEENKSE